MLDIIGWVATILIIISFTFKDIYRLRFFSMIGAFVWTLYGFMSGTYSIIILNVVIAIIQIYWLIKLNKKRRVSEKNIYDK